MRQGLQDSLVLVHGGMAQNVGPVLEMVTEKYLLRSEVEWTARKEALRIFDELLAALRANDVHRIGALTGKNFAGPIQSIIPAASNLFTETLIDHMGRHFGPDFGGFWMLGGMSGGGMGFLVAPHRKAEAQDYLLKTMKSAKRELEHALPFAMEPVVYDFAINERGTYSELLAGDEALLPPVYYALVAPRLAARRSAKVDAPPPRRAGPLWRRLPEPSRDGRAGRDSVRPHAAPTPRRLTEAASGRLEALLLEHGFDREQHERIRADLRRGRIGLAQNRLPASAVIEDVHEGDVVDATSGADARCVALGRQALAEGQAAVVTPWQPGPAAAGPRAPAW